MNFLRTLLITITMGCFMLYIMVSFVTFSIQSARKDPINITSINVSPGFIIPEMLSLSFRGIKGVTGFVFSSDAALTLSIQSGSMIEHLKCQIDTRGSDYCDIDIAENGMSCDCYQ